MLESYGTGQVVYLSLLIACPLIVLATLNILFWSIAIPLAFVNWHPAEEYETVEPHLLCDSSILPPRPMRAHTHAHTGIVVEGVLWSSRGERICHMLWLAPLLSSYQLLSKRRFYKIRLVDAVVHFKLLPKLCFRTAILVSNQDFSLTLIEAASHLGQKTIKTLVPRILDVLHTKWNTAFIMNMAS